MIQHGDLFDVLPTIADQSIDACVTDPPYGIGFMGREWDTFKPGSGQSRKLMHPREREAAKAIVSENPNIHGRHRSPALSPSQIDYYSVAGLRGFQEWTETWAREVFRVLKPGAYVLVCGAPRSYHRMACGLEDAGFELRDSIDFLLSVEPMFAALWDSLEIDQQEILARVLASYDGHLSWVFGSGFPKSLNFDGGLGTALKPAHEPIVVARKPFRTTVASNLATFGTGALNIDACRIGLVGDDRPTGSGNRESWREMEGRTDRQPANGGNVTPDAGRWPANVLLDEEAAAMLDEQSGELSSGDAHVLRRGATTGAGMGYGSSSAGNVLNATYGDSGGASRFFYVAKPSRSEREIGCDGLTRRQRDDSRKAGNPGGDNPRNRGLQLRGNTHPTVKPVELMRWLVRLVTPPGGTVLDPFAGSFTTALACILEHRPFIMIEREAEYVEIGKARIRAIAPLFVNADEMMQPQQHGGDVPRTPVDVPVGAPRESSTPDCPESRSVCPDPYDAPRDLTEVGHE